MYMKGLASQEVINKRRLRSRSQAGNPLHSSVFLSILHACDASSHPALSSLAKMTQEKKALRVIWWKKSQLAS